MGAGGSGVGRGEQSKNKEPLPRLFCIARLRLDCALCWHGKALQTRRKPRDLTLFRVALIS